MDLSMGGKGREGTFSIIDRKCQFTNKIVFIQGPGRFSKTAESMGGISKDGYGIVPGTGIVRQKGSKKGNRSMRPAERILRYPIWQVTWRKTCHKEKLFPETSLARHLIFRLNEVARI